ncbi:MAG TPA: CDP-alcohol phosphatidyltransferase family protein [Acidimicrobiales bacterium]|jgi:cardiolipin synthase
MTIPNLITIARLLMVPVIIVMLMQGEWGWAFALFLAAGVSDGIDGYLARRLDMRTEFGAYIDPLADKALLVSLYVTLPIIGVLPGWLAIVIVSRDLMIIAAIMVSWLMDRPVEIKPLAISKLNTAVQIAFAALILGKKAFGFELDAFDTAGMWVVTALTVASVAAYLAKWLRHMAA